MNTKEESMKSKVTSHINPQVPSPRVQGKRAPHRVVIGHFEDEVAVAVPVFRHTAYLRVKLHKQTGWRAVQRVSGPPSNEARSFCWGGQRDGGLAKNK